MVPHAEQAEASLQGFTKEQVTALCHDSQVAPPQVILEHNIVYMNLLLGGSRKACSTRITLACSQ